MAVFRDAPATCEVGAHHADRPAWSRAGRLSWMQPLPDTQAGRDAAVRGPGNGTLAGMSVEFRSTRAKGSTAAFGRYNGLILTGAGLVDIGFVPLGNRRAARARGAASAVAVILDDVVQYVTGQTLADMDLSERAAVESVIGAATALVDRYAAAAGVPDAIRREAISRRGFFRLSHKDFPSKWQPESLPIPSRRQSVNPLAEFGSDGAAVTVEGAPHGHSERRGGSRPGPPDRGP